ncbi:alpha-hydroxy-acid oxidizing protein [Sphingomonas sp. C8-2]|jgi:L-lactate dehydrogenase (cytochrome)|nr:alpha-hydroxy-acid oxidizing protein [Sphingomonas sp. C8-2]
MQAHRIHDIADLRRRAARKLPRPIFDYIEGGAEDELALRDSRAAFDRYRFLPRMLTDVSSPHIETELFGRRLPLPLMLSPTGLTRLFHKRAELAVAEAVRDLGLPYCLSTMGTTTMEEFAQAVPGPRLFQIYIFRDRGLTEEFVDRAKAAGYDGLVLTVDTAVAGHRQRDLVNGLSIPPRLTLRGFLGFATRPAWSLPALLGRPFEFVNVAHRATGAQDGDTSLHAYVADQFDRSLTWADVEWLAARWSGPLAVKGILAAADARRALDAGADTVMLSNHGGRQLESAMAPIDCVAPVADAVGGRMKIVCDGGIRRGRDIVKALALGADACSIGRAYLYGLAAGGADGVRHAIELLRSEYERTLTLAGIADRAALGPELLRRAGGA